MLFLSLHCEGLVILVYIMKLHIIIKITTYFHTYIRLGNIENMINTAKVLKIYWGEIQHNFS